MNTKLFFQAIAKFSLGLAIVITLLFLPANSFRFLNAWLFIGLLFIPMFIAGIVLMIKNPKLLERRLESKEKEKEQKWLILCSGLMFFMGFIAASLDYRYKLTSVPSPIVTTSAILFLVSYAIYGEVFRENAYLYRTVKVEENQKLINTGLYAIVRHPMYAATTLMFLIIPLILGSWISFLVFLPYPFFIVKRIENEEIVLERDLEGYSEYKKRVKYKLFPFIW